MEEIGATSGLLEYTAVQNEELPYRYDISISVETAGVYYLSILLNEDLVGSSPLELRVT